MVKSFLNDLTFDVQKIQTKVILENSFSKEIRILLAKDQIMKEHKSPFPITVYIVNGSIDFMVNEEVYPMRSGDIISLDSNVIHSLKAAENSIIRLTLSKQDRIERVEAVTE